MSALITVDLGSGAKKVQEEFEKYYNLTIKNGAKDIADSYAQQAAEKTKAEIEAVIASVEATVEEIALKGANELYNALGLNEETINFAKKIVMMATNATNLAGAVVLKGMLALNSFDTQAIPMSAMAAALQIIKSIADIFFQKFIEMYGIYIDLVIQFILDPGSVIEILKEQLDQILEQIEGLINEQCILYLGMSLAQIKYYCRKGIGLYKQMKAAKKAKKAAQDEQSNQGPVVSGSGSKKKVSVTVQLDSETLKANMMAWLNSQRDAIYNAFMILQIKDAINSIKEVIKMMTDINLATLADNMDSLDDLVQMLDELGLGDDSTAIDLSLIPSLNINEIYAGLNNLASMQTLENQVGALKNSVMPGGAAYVGVMSSINVDFDVSSEKTFDISTDTSTKTITVVYYTNPSKQSVAKKVNSVFTKAKDAEDKALFSLSDCKVIQEKTLELYNNNIKTGKGETTFSAGNYTIKIKLEISVTKKEVDKTDTKTPAQIQQATKETPDIQLMVVDETMKSADQIDKERATTRRNTIALLHTLFSIIKSINPLLKTLATLVQNYKTNKAYAASKSQENLYQLYKECMKKLGLDKSKEFTANSVSGNPSDVIYTVRTYQLYMFLRNDMRLIDDGTTIKDISVSDAIEINKWLDIHDSASAKVNMTQPSQLYIDYASINEQINCIKEQTEELSQVLDTNLVDAFVSCTAKYRNGTFEDLENMEIVGNTIIYSDKNLPRMGSQILMAQMRGYKPYE